MFHAFFGSFADFFIFENLPFPGKNPVGKRDSEDIYRKVPERGTAGGALCNIIFIAFFVSIFLFFTYKNPTGKAEESTQNPSPETADNAPAGKPAERAKNRLWKAGGAGEKSASESGRKRPESRQCNLRRREKPGKKQARGAEKRFRNPFQNGKNRRRKVGKRNGKRLRVSAKREKTPPRNIPGNHRKSRQKTGVRIRTFPILSIYLWMLRLCLAPVGGDLHRPLPFYGFSPAPPRRFVSSLKKW